MKSTIDQLLAELNEFLPVDSGLFVSEDEETDTMIFMQILNFINHVLWVADAIVAPEFPLRAE